MRLNLLWIGIYHFHNIKRLFKRPQGSGSSCPLLFSIPFYPQVRKVLSIYSLDRWSVIMITDLEFLWQISDMTPMVVTYDAIGHSNYVEFLHDSYSSVIYLLGPVDDDWYHVNFWGDSWYWFGLMYECVRLIMEVWLNCSSQKSEIGIRYLFLLLS